MQVAVVGAGIHGSSSAKSLAERGHHVSLFDRYALGHAYGSSHGESRIVRKAYPDSYYTSLMASAYPLWSRLEAQSGKKLLHEVGLLYFGDANSPQLQSMVAGLAEVGVPHKVLDSGAVRNVMPDIRLEAGEVGIFTPEAGWVDATLCLDLTQRLATDRGARFFPSTPVEIERLESEFDAYVVTPGPWINDWVAGLQIAVTLQTVAYFRAKVTGPVWIEDSEDLAYGFPTYSDELGAKVAFHSLGALCDPHSTDREPDPLKIEALKDVLCRRMGMSDAPMKRAYGCLYTNTPDEDFRVGRIGSKGFYASVCSGHGFKFGPWVGELMANFVEKKDTPENWPRFCRDDPDCR